MVYFNLVILPARTWLSLLCVTGDAGGGIQPIDSAIKDKIHQLVGEGVSTLTEMKQLLCYYVKNELFRGRETPPETNRAFYPRDSVIKNHIHLSRSAERALRMDQENFSNLIASWQNDADGDAFYYRMKEAVAELADAGECESASTDVQAATDTDAGSMVFVYQNQFQRDLIQKYGNVLMVVDSTSKLIKAASQLYTISVKTTVVDLAVVAVIVAEKESAKSVAEALAILRQWAPQWKPAIAMADFSAPVMAALEETFPGGSASDILFLNPLTNVSRGVRI